MVHGFSNRDSSSPNPERAISLLLFGPYQYISSNENQHLRPTLQPKVESHVVSLSFRRGQGEVLETHFISPDKTSTSQSLLESLFYRTAEYLCGRCAQPKTPRLKCCQSRRESRALSAKPVGQRPIGMASR
jgi:hypothetical protein